MFVNVSNSFFLSEGENNNNNISMTNNSYFDRAGFGSKKQTLKDAIEKEKTITMADIDIF